MTTIIIVGEGQTEEAFVRDVLAPSFVADSIFIEPRVIRTSSSSRGGALERPRVLRYLRNTLREREDTYVTTLFDLYRLPIEFTHAIAQLPSDPVRRAAKIEKHFSELVIAEAGCRADRFFAYLQPYEFEALLFSDVEGLVRIEPEWGSYLPELQAARVEHASPEHINDGPTTHPSARLQTLSHPTYDKVRHGPIAATEITLARIERECQHFAQWVNKLRTLPNLV